MIILLALPCIIFDLHTIIEQTLGHYCADIYTKGNRNRKKGIHLLIGSGSQ